MTEDKLTPDQVQAGIQAWLLQQDMLSDAELRGCGPDPADPDVLRQEEAALEEIRTL